MRGTDDADTVWMWEGCGEVVVEEELGGRRKLGTPPRVGGVTTLHLDEPVVGTSRVDGEASEQMLRENRAGEVFFQVKDQVKRVNLGGIRGAFGQGGMGGGRKLGGGGGLKEAELSV